MSICRPKQPRQVGEEKNGKLDEPPKKKDRATLEKEFAESHGEFKMGLVHWAIVVVIFVPLLFLFWQRFRVGAPINNSLIQYGPVPREVTYAYWVVFSFIVTATTVTWVAKLGTKMLTIRGLWIAYFLVGTMFNLVAMDILPDHLNSEHQLGNVRHNGFIATSWMHLIVEAMLLVSVFVPKSQCDWYWTRLVVYGYIINFLACTSRQKTFSIYILVGGVGSLPSDTLTLIAGYAIYRRAKDWSVKLLAIGWALHMPGILLILSFMNYRSKMENSWTGFALAFVQFQYALVAYSLSKHIVLRDLPDDELEKELREKGIMAPDPELDEEDDTEKGGLMKQKKDERPVWTMKDALFALNLLVTLMTVVYIIVPWFTGYLDMRNFIE